ncbi:hypothetical protein GCM10009575_050200 [Streptomyces rhizosphaericus]|uniref:Uncharacterized protein n=1 Tax=Streptomyces rhizosphaericus TaxID=114699 RepID=A0ABN1Q685_9ACTN
MARDGSPATTRASTSRSRGVSPYASSNTSATSVAGAGFIVTATDAGYGPPSYHVTAVFREETVPPCRL